MVQGCEKAGSRMVWGNEGIAGSSVPLPQQVTSYALLGLPGRITWCSARRPAHPTRRCRPFGAASRSATTACRQAPALSKQIMSEMLKVSVSKTSFTVA